MVGQMKTGNDAYADKVVLFLKDFFLHASTKMNPHLLYTQAIPGISLSWLRKWFATT